MVRPTCYFHNSMTETKELTCSVCKDFYRNPYELPCGHSYCRRPCLLQTPSSVFGRCNYCHIEVHESQLQHNAELEERVQKYLAKEGRSKSRRVACDLCRSLHEKCTLCSHCDRQLCDLCFKEHIGEFQRRLRREFEGLREAGHTLKRSRETLASIQNSAERRMALTERIDAAAIGLKSACESAYWRAEAQLERIEAHSKNQPFALRGKSDLLKIADRLLRTVNSPKQHEDIRKLCEVRQTAQNAVDTLAALKALKAGQEHPAFCNLHLSESLESISERLDNLDLLVDSSSAQLTTWKKGLSRSNILKVKGFHWSRAGARASFRLPDDYNQRNVRWGPVFLTRQMESTVPTASSSNHLLQQQQQELDREQNLIARTRSFTAPRQQQRAPSPQQILLRRQPSFGNSWKQFRLLLDGLKARITDEDLETHFAQFGEVLSMKWYINPVTGEYSGHCCLTLWSTMDACQILRREHFVRGVRINVRTVKPVLTSEK